MVQKEEEEAVRGSTVMAGARLSQPAFVLLLRLPHSAKILAR